MSVKIVGMEDKTQPKGAKRARPTAPRQRMKKEVGLADPPTLKKADAPNGEQVGATLMARPYHHGNLREDLVRCGKQQLDEVGMDGLSLRRIASKVGVSQVAPMHHFGNKEGLLAAIAASGFRDLTEFRFSRLRPQMSAEQRFRSQLSSYVTFAWLRPMLFHLMFGPQFRSRQKHAELDAASAHTFQLLSLAALDFMIEQGKGDETKAIEMARIAWMCMHGVATLIVDFRINPAGAPVVNREQLVNRALDLVFAGIRGLNVM